MSQAAKSVRTSAAPKHRTGAREKHFIPNYPTKLFIYRHNASKYWWVRYFVNGNAVRKSTKTDSKRDAIAFAKEYFDLITHNQQLGINSTASVTSFQSCLTQLLDAEKAKLERGEISKITYDNNKYRYQKSILPYFRDKEVRDIDYFTVERYLNELSTKNLSSTTVSTYLLLVKKFLEYAARRKLIVAVPQFPKLKVKKVSRGWFNVSEYRTLYVFLPQYQNRGYALKQLQRQWEVLMHDTGLATNVTGEERTIYSLRHTAIMYRLIFGDGINTLMLARNARKTVEAVKRVKQWWFVAENGKVCLQVRYGTRVIELANGKNSVEVGSGEELLAVLKAVKTAVEAGELDAQIDAASAAVRERFAH